jgi:hypothetical protein
MAVARNAVFFPYLAPGGGATEMAVSIGLAKKGKEAEGAQGGPYRAVADAMEVIPRTLIQNSGGNVIRVLTELRVRVLFLLFFFWYFWWISVCCCYARLSFCLIRMRAFDFISFDISNPCIRFCAKRRLLNIPSASLLLS